MDININELHICDKYHKNTRWFLMLFTLFYWPQNGADALSY